MSRPNAGTPRRLGALTVLVFSTIVLAAAATGFTASAFAAGAGLPDGRAYELVSTSGIFGEPYIPTSPFEASISDLEYTEHPFQAAENGEAVTYVGEPPATGGTGETHQGLGDQWLAERTSQGWVTSAITPTITGTSESYAVASEHPVYQAFAADLSSGVFLGPLQPLAAGVLAQCRVLYSRAAGGGGYRALYTPGETSPIGGTIGVCGNPLFAGSSQDESQVIFQSEAALTKGAVEATEVPPGHEGSHAVFATAGYPCVFGCNLYASVGGRLRLVNVVEGRQVPSATFGGYGEAAFKFVPGTNNEFTDFSNAISTDGSRIFWTDTMPGPADFKHVYVQEDGAGAVPVSLGAAEYWTATPDGRYAFYTEGGELWRFDTDPGAPEPRRRLTAEGAGVLGVVGTNQTGQDGAYVYFVAEGELAANKNVEGDVASSGKPNLYLDHEGVTTFIATLSPEDNEIVTTTELEYSGGDWRANVGRRTAEVSPDGRHLVFESSQSLTGYDNIGIGERLAAAEVFVYSADDGLLACASCNPTGKPPTILEPANKDEYAETRLPESSNSNTYLRRWMSANGNRVFFDSEQPLVPQDTNGVQDVYEWEREGEGSCTAQDVSPVNHGCVYLLSGGEGRGYSFLVDADASGENVFFEHVGPLGQAQVSVDHNELYDARVGGGFPQPSLACAGAACQGGPPPQPSFQSPASAGLAGTGNLPPSSSSGPPGLVVRGRSSLARALAACRRGPRRARAGCERRARRRFSTKGKVSVGRSRRAGR